MGLEHDLIGLWMPELFEFFEIIEAEIEYPRYAFRGL